MGWVGHADRWRRREALGFEGAQQERINWRFRPSLVPSCRRRTCERRHECPIHFLGLLLRPDIADPAEAFGAVRAAKDSFKG